MNELERITRRILLKKTAAFAMASVSLQGCSQSKRLFAQHIQKDRPNIILVMADNVGFTEFGINTDDKKRRSFLALLFAAGYAER